ncbi:MAG: hypothetical protein LAQ30_32275, partial [Acidobacteriia bacterium]|nr:hypothetical protein [Terriglobia bacterium]
PFLDEALRAREIVEPLLERVDDLDKVRIAATVNTSTGDLNRTLVQGGVDYTLSANHGLSFQYDYIQNSGFKDDNVASLIYRFNF